MSRPLRVEREGAWYHVMNRGRGGQVIFPETSRLLSAWKCRHIPAGVSEIRRSIIEAAAAASGFRRAELTARARPGRSNSLEARELAMRLCRDEIDMTLRKPPPERDVKTDRRLNNDILSRLDS